MLLNLRLCSLVVIDSSTHFKGAFIVMFYMLHLCYELVAKGNHKAVTVENFH